MISDTILSQLVCSLSNDRHFIKNPLILTTCGHSICSGCIPNDLKLSIKCGICGNETLKSLMSNNESERINALFDEKKSFLVKILHERIESELRKLQNYTKDAIETIGIKIKHIEEEVEIRVESIKIELDEIHEMFKNELNNCKNDLIEYEKRKEDRFVKDIKYYATKLEELRNDISENNNDRFYNYQNDFIKLNDTFEVINRIDYQLELHLSNEKITKKLIGDFLFRIHEIEIKEINNKIKFFDFKQINLPDRPLDMIVLPNSKILATNYFEKSISFFDESLNLVKKVNTIDNQTVQPYSLALNENGIFISDHYKDQIIFTDFDINHIKSYGNKGSDHNQFDSPCGISYNNKCLYVCDYNNKRIQILNSGLEHVQETIPLGYCPWLVIASDKTLAVSRCDSNASLYFYDLKNKYNLRYVYQKGECRINEINSCFYAFSFSAKKMYSFDTYGNFVDETKLNRLSNLISNIADGCLISFKNNLVITFYTNSLAVLI